MYEASAKIQMLSNTNQISELQEQAELYKNFIDLSSKVDFIKSQSFMELALSE